MRTLFFSLLTLCFFTQLQAQTTLTESNNNGVVEVSTTQAGEQLIISLKASAGTPYRWILKSNNTEVLAYDGEETKSSSPASSNGIPNVGGSTNTNFKFHYTGNEGESQVVLKLVSVAGGDVSKTVQYTVRVTNEAPAPDNTIYLDKADSGTEINIDASVSSGATLQVNLNYYAGTPYHWELVNNNEEILPIVNRESYDPNASSSDDIPKTGGERVASFSFIVTGVVGTSKMKFNLVSFNGEVAETVWFDISVSH